MVKNLPAMWETQVQSLGWEDPLEKGMIIHSSIFAWEIPRTEECGELQSMQYTTYKSSLGFDKYTRTTQSHETTKYRKFKSFRPSQVCSYISH